MLGVVVDFAGAEPAVDSLPEQLWVHAEDVAVLGTSHDQLSPCFRIALVGINRAPGRPLSPTVQVCANCQVVLKQDLVGYGDLRYDSIRIDDSDGIRPLA